MFKNVVVLDEALKQGMLPALETFPCPFDSEKTGSGVVRIVFPEFTCVCPRTGYPDFAKIIVLYQPDSLCIELKAWKLYLNSFRMIGSFHESVTAHLFATLGNLLSPRWLLVAGDFLPRGNVDTTVIFETPGVRPPGADLLLGTLTPHCKNLED